MHGLSPVERGPEAVSVRVSPEAKYPETASLSPHERYPEYPFADISPERNEPYQMLRDCLVQLNLDGDNLGSKKWNPLGQWIRRGDKVMVLPNLVSHGRTTMSEAEHQARLTHGSVLRAALDYVFLACGSASNICFGNAPLQSCRYDEVARQSHADSVADFYRTHTGATIGPFDCRAVSSVWTRFGTLSRMVNRSEAETVAVDLGSDSLLDELFQNRLVPPQVRVGDYRPAETLSYHACGKHVYLLNKRLLEADVIVSVPKLKTHQKVGLTCTLKGTVGAIARKECLAHHRAGGPGEGGDEFSRSSRLNRLATRLSDRAASGGVGPIDNSWRLLSKAFYKSLRSMGGGHGGGAWHKNDTAWRMTLDIARILRFARPDGTMSAAPVRKHLGIVDGVTAGEGNGPLAPKAAGFGAVIFGSDVCAVDHVCSQLIGFRPEAMPLIREAFRLASYPLTSLHQSDLSVIYNGLPLAVHEVPCVRPLIPPAGWRNHIEDGCRGIERS